LKEYTVSSDILGIGQKKSKRHIPNEGVNLLGLDGVQLLDGILDLVLVGVNINDEDEGVVLLNALHGGLSGQRELEDGELVKTGLVGDGLTNVLGLAGKSEGLGATEDSGGSDLLGLGGLSTLLEKLGSLQSLLLGGFGLLNDLLLGLLLFCKARKKIPTLIQPRNNYQNKY
jgi:hypothetical protein